jgi:hypothetical protein
MFEEKVEPEEIKINNSFEFRWTSINVWFLLIFIIVMWLSFSRYVVHKNFLVQIETPCDPVGELCFYRDCDKDECPPNGLSTYRTWQTNAGIFAKCDVDQTCENTCENEPGNCTEIVCDPKADICKTQLYL